MIKLSIFNDYGLQIFKGFIESKGAKKLPDNFLTNEKYSDIISPSIELDELKAFADRLDMAVYLNGMIDSELFEQYHKEPKFWSWFCCLYIDQIVLNGKFSNPEHYFYTPGRVVYRHSVAMPVKTYRQYGHDISRLLISRKINVWGELAEQVVGRQSIMRSKELLNFIVQLYYDKDKDDLKPSTRSKINDKILKDGVRSRAGEGGARRVALQIKRLALNYKVDSMDVKNLNLLLPSEYDKFVS